jgi:4-methyl-5(b-hydroxyethyl)-thiazole monophosphate biosynthesis
MPTVLVILPEGFEEIEALAPVDLLRRAGVDVTLATQSLQRHATGRSGVTVHGDASLDEVGGTLFDMVVLPGGPGVKNLRADPGVADLVTRHHRAGRRLAAICAAPTVLNAAGLLAGKRYTAHPSVAGELPAILADQRVVTDGNITTSRGAGTALDFGLQLVEILVSSTKAAEIGKAICLQDLS